MNGARNILTKNIIENGLVMQETAPFGAWGCFLISMKSGSAMELLAEALKASGLIDRVTFPIDCYPR